MSDDPRRPKDLKIPRHTGKIGPYTRSECIKCGERFGNLPNHLRSCEGTDE